MLADDPSLDGPGRLRRAHDFENAADRVREQRWGPRTLDVDIVSCRDGGVELRSDDPVLTLPHPLAHQRAFVLVPWLAADPEAELRGVPVAELLAGLDADERDGVRPSDLVLVP